MCAVYDKYSTLILVLRPELQPSVASPAWPSHAYIWYAYTHAYSIAMEPRRGIRGEGTYLLDLPLVVKDQRKQCHVEAEDEENVAFGEAVDDSNDLLRTRHRGSSASTQGTIIEHMLRTLMYLPCFPG